MTPTQQAYGLLWLSPMADELQSKAREILRYTLSREEREEAVKWAIIATRRTTQGLEMQQSTSITRP